MDSYTKKKTSFTDAKNTVIKAITNLNEDKKYKLIVNNNPEIFTEKTIQSLNSAKVKIDKSDDNYETFNNSVMEYTLIFLKIFNL